MTAVRPGLPSPSPSAGDAPLVPSSCRVSILVGDSHQIDLVLPSAVPLSALTDATRAALLGSDQGAVGPFALLAAWAVVGIGAAALTFRAE